MHPFEKTIRDLAATGTDVPGRPAVESRLIRRRVLDTTLDLPGPVTADLPGRTRRDPYDIDLHDNDQPDDGGERPDRPAPAGDAMPTRLRELETALRQPTLSARDIGLLRREIAALLHPDRHAAADRRLATELMQSANALLDDALRRAAPAS